MKIKQYRLGDVCKLRNGYAFKSESFSTEGVPVIRISNINDDKASTKNSLKTKESAVLEKFVVKKGDILIAMSGATTGKFGKYESDEKAYQNQRVGCFIITDEEKLSNDYLYLLLKGLKKTIEKDAYGGGQPNISSQIIENYKIQLPSLDEQLRISTLLNKAETVIKLRARSIAMLDEFTKMKFLESFGDPVRNEKGWELKNGEFYLSKLTVGVVVKPATYYVDEGIIALRSLNVRPNKIVLRDLVYFSKDVNEGIFSKSILRQGDVVFVRTGLTGTAAIIPKELDGCNCIDLIITRPKDGVINADYLVFFFNSDIGKKIVATQEVGGMQKHFNIGALKKLKIPVPPIELQNQFANIIIKTEALKNKYLQGLNELKMLYSSLSQKAFRGDLDLGKLISFRDEEYPTNTNDHPVTNTINVNHSYLTSKTIPEMSLDEYYGIPEELVDRHGSIEDKIIDWEFFLKKYFADKVIEIEEVASLFDKLYYDRGLFFEYEHFKNFVFQELKQESPFLKQSFDDNNSKRIFLTVKNETP